MTTERKKRKFSYWVSCLGYNPIHFAGRKKEIIVEEATGKLFQNLFVSHYNELNTSSPTKHNKLILKRQRQLRKRRALEKGAVVLVMILLFVLAFVLILILL